MREEKGQESKPNSFLASLGVEDLCEVLSFADINLEYIAVFDLLGPMYMYYMCFGSSYNL